MDATRLSRLHPYPAMVADELAIRIVRKYVPEGATILDPFCGSGRLLVAAERAALRVGIDVNPLAVLLTTAKLGNASAAVIEGVLSRIACARRRRHKVTFAFVERRQVDWFGASVLSELGRIVGWINGLKLPKPERWLVASALSATVREVSYARQSGWKLHRLGADERGARQRCPWQCLERRLRYAIAELRLRDPVSGERFVALGRVGARNGTADSVESLGPYDVVLTSPPYGDSRSTVQYGAASALCLGVVARIEGLDHLAMAGNEIDSSCLGGRSVESSSRIDVKAYWAGARNTKLARKVDFFLSDYEKACEAIAKNVKPGGTAILVVGRRSTGGFRLKLDDFTVDCLARKGFELMAREARTLQRKRVPRRINRFGRSKSASTRKRGAVLTMAKEIVLILRKAS